MDLPEQSQAKLFRNTQQGSRFDDESFLDLENDHQNKMKQQIQQMNMQAQAQTDGINIANVQQPPKAPPTSQQPPTATPINPTQSYITPTPKILSPQMHDMTGGDREEEDRDEMEKAMIAAYEKK